MLPYLSRVAYGFYRLFYEGFLLGAYSVPYPETRFTRFVNEHSLISEGGDIGVGMGSACVFTHMKEAETHSTWCMLKKQCGTYTRTQSRPLFPCLRFGFPCQPLQTKGTRFIPRLLLGLVIPVLDKTNRSQGRSRVS